MAFSQVGIVPVLCVVFALLAFFIGYAIALSNDHIDAWLPFISDCGAIPPESNIFGILLNFAGIFVAFTVYLVHRNCICFYKNLGVDIGNWKYFSWFMGLVGFIAALGAIIVGNFQESTQLPTHMVGASCFFIGIIVYFWGQLIIAYSLRPKIVSIHLTNFRLILTFSLTLILIFHIICLTVQPFVKRENGKLPAHDPWPNNIERPDPNSPYFTNHILAAFSEWLLALLALLHILTYTYDLALTEMHEVRLVRTDSSKDSISADTVLVANHKDRLQPYGFDGFASPTAIAVMPDHYSETASHRRLPRVDKVYPNSSVYSNRIVPRTNIALSSGTIYSPYQHY